MAENQSKDYLGLVRAAKGAPVDWVNAVFLVTTPFIAVLGTAWYAKVYGVTWVETGVFFLMYALTGIGITAGYHRCFSHLTYKASRPLQLFYLIFGAAAVENSALNWCSDHRYHHRYVDKDEDPYNILRGFFFAHMGWIFFKDARQNHIRFANVPDLLKNPLVMWQHRWYMVLVVLVCFAFPALLSAALGRSWLGGLLIGGFLRVVVVQHMTFLINSAAHYWGSRPYSLTDTARDNALLGPLTFGEGYHNFHHKFQADYRNGYRWYQFDVGKWWLLAMAALGQAKSLKRTPEALILKARLEVESQRVAQRLAASNVSGRMWEKVNARLEAGRRRVEAALIQYQHAKAEYRHRRDQWSADMRRQWKEKAELYQAEFDEARRRWRDLIRAMNRISHPSAQTALSLTLVLDILKMRIW